MIIGTLPVVIAVTSNLRDARRDGRLPWLRLLPSLVRSPPASACVNQVELAALRADPAGGSGALCGGCAAGDRRGGCWTWYPIRNADWLRAHAERSPRTWATAQGLATLHWRRWAWPRSGLECGKRQSVCDALGADAGTVRCADAGHRLLAHGWARCAGTNQPAAADHAGRQLIVFETLAALAYAFMLRGQAPEPVTLAGVALLVAGVMWALRVRPEPLAADAHPN